MTVTRFLNATSSLAATPAFVWPSSDANTIKGNSVATTMDHEATSFSRASGPASSVPPTFQTKEPAFSATAIAGVAAGSTILLALFLGATFLLLRHRKHNQTKNQPRPISTLLHEPGNSEIVYEKAELDGRALEHQHSEIGVSAPLRYAEIDTDTTVSPVREQVYISASERNARIAQNF